MVVCTNGNCYIYVHTHDSQHNNVIFPVSLQEKEFLKQEQDYKKGISKLK